MALKHYEGELLPSVGSAPPPVPVSPTAPPSETTTAAPLDALTPREGAARTFPPEYRGVIVIVQGNEPGAPEAIGIGPTVQEAFKVACGKWEALQVQALRWEDGTEVSGLPRQVLVEALEMYEQLGGLPDEVRLTLGRLKGALGE
jgi:hypothetical protein